MAKHLPNINSVTSYIDARRAILAALLSQVSPGLSGTALLALAQAWARLTGAGPGDTPPLTEAESALAEQVRGRLLETVTTVSAALETFPTSPVTRFANETHAAELRDLTACLTLLLPARSGDC